MPFAPRAVDFHGFRDAQNRVAPPVATDRGPVGAKETSLARVRRPAADTPLSAGPDTPTITNTTISVTGPRPAVSSGNYLYAHLFADALKGRPAVEHDDEWNQGSQLGTLAE